MSLMDPTSKMSKSHPQERSRILITDPPDVIVERIKGAKTDSIEGVSYNHTLRPGVSNLLDILAVFDAERRTSAELATHYSSASCKDLKVLVTESVTRGLAGFRDNYLQLLASDDGYLEFVEAEGTRKARESAGATMQLVRDALGL